MARQFNGRLREPWLGDLPENWQNSLYPIGTPYTNYQGALDGSNEVFSNQLQTTKILAAKPYPLLPFAGPGVQLLASIPSNVPSIYKQVETVAPNGVISIVNTAPPPILIATVEPVSTPVVPPPPIINPTTPPTSIPGAPRGAPKRTNLQGLIPTEEMTAFPYETPHASATGNLWWYTGQPTLNRGFPAYYNDANEWIRHAMVESDWDSVEAWLAWIVANGFDQSQLHLIDFGRYKYIPGIDGSKRQLPFSWADYESFFNRFLKYTSSLPVDADCMRTKLDLYRRAIASGPRNQFRLNLSDCPLSPNWALGLLKAVGLFAAFAAIALTGGALAAPVSSAVAGTTAAGATGASIGASGAAVGAAVGAAAIPVIETVVVTAAPVIFGGAAAATAAAISAGAIAIAAAPPPISPPSIAPQAPPVAPPAPPLIETVLTEASALPTVNIAPIAASVISTVAAAPAIFTPSTPIETVTVEAPRTDQFALDPATADFLGTAALTLPTPDIELVEPQAPDVEDSNLDKIKSELKKAAEPLGSDAIKSQLEKYLQKKLEREATQEESDFFADYLDSLPVPTRRPPVMASTNASTLALLFGLVAAAILLKGKNRGK